LNGEIRSFIFGGQDLYFSSMCFHDVITKAQTKPGPLPGWFGGKKGLKDFIYHFWGYPVPIIGYRDGYFVISFFCGDRNGGLIFGIR
jgi:hypothetical protein